MAKRTTRIFGWLTWAFGRTCDSNKEMRSAFLAVPGTGMLCSTSMDLAWSVPCSHDSTKEISGKMRDGP